MIKNIGKLTKWWCKEKWYSATILAQDIEFYLQNFDEINILNL